MGGDHSFLEFSEPALSLLKGLLSLFQDKESDKP
jgi:hypothetical protein